MAEMGQQQVAGQAAPAITGIDGDRQYFGFVRRIRDTAKPMTLRPALRR